MHSPHDVLPANGTLIHPFATLGARHHVTALEQDTVDHCVHADPAEVVVVDGQRTLLAICRTDESGDGAETNSGLSRDSIDCIEDPGVFISDGKSHAGSPQHYSDEDDCQRLSANAGLFTKVCLHSEDIVDSG